MANKHKKCSRLGAGGSCLYPSCSGGRDQEDHSSKPAWANSSQDPISKKSVIKKGLMGWLKLEKQLPSKHEALNANPSAEKKSSTSTSLAIRKCNTASHSKPSENGKCWQGCRETEALAHWWWECNSTASLENIMARLQKQNWNCQVTQPFHFWVHTQKNGKQRHEELCGHPRSQHL
jgi:hypothetical protein